jgi:hypothetical protein
MTLSQLERRNLVSDVCEQSNATSLLEDLLRNPKHPEFGHKLSAALNEAILLKQGTTKDRSNLLLSTNKLTSIFAKYINSCKNESYLSRKIEILDDSGELQRMTQDFKLAHRSARDDQLHFRKEWDSLIDDKGYPSSWKDAFTKQSDSHMKSIPPPFDPEFLQKLRIETMRELRRNEILRDGVWGETCLEGASKEDVKSWEQAWGMEWGRI